MRLTLNFRGINGVKLSQVILDKIVSRHTPAISGSANANNTAVKQTIETHSSIFSLSAIGRSSSVPGHKKRSRDTDMNESTKPMTGEGEQRIPTNL
jgi:hypothetical protein